MMREFNVAIIHLAEAIVDNELANILTLNRMWYMHKFMQVQAVLVIYVLRILYL
jgi:hypothetical protein